MKKRICEDYKKEIISKYSSRNYLKYTTDPGQSSCEQLEVSRKKAEGSKCITVI